VVESDCPTAGVELVVLDDEVGAGVTGVGVAALELAAEDGAVGAAATAEVVAPEVDAALVVDDVGVVSVVEADPVVLDAALAAASVAEVTISPLVGVSERNEDALGSWMFASALRASPFGCAARKPTACAGGITMPIDAASCSIRWSSPSVATLWRNEALRLESTELRSSERPMLAPSFSTSTCIATIPASITPSTGIHQRPRISRSSSL
jgi:hypothetical protein